MSARLVLAVDGGNSKTDLALLREDGELLALVRGGNSSPHHIGLDGTVALLEALHAEALVQAALDGAARAAVGHLLLAGLDLPVEEERLRAAVAGRWAERLTVGNDTFAVLRAGTERGWGVAVVCGAGINCVGVGPDGRHVRFPALGAISGDWGGGYDVGMAALSAAVRSEDGRGQRTELERTVPAHYGLATPDALVEAIHLGRIPHRRVVELAPVVLEAAATDPAAAAIVDRLAAEVLAFVRAALHRLALDGAAVEVLLGGGMFRTADGRLLAAIEAGLRELGGAATLRVADSQPIVGAALLGLDDLGARPEAQARARRELGAAAEDIGTTGEVSVHG
ncbi:MAG: BadF/BadG/BcrA/BcrD ATPase family protein [Solirubrobacteraceae bacterium]